MNSLLPLIAFEPTDLTTANCLLTQWGHQMGPVLRGNQQGWHHVLLHDGQPVAVTSACHLMSPNVGGGARWLRRENTVELSRLCAARPDLCRVVLRLWREFVFPSMGFEFAMSYQDANLHTGNTYRFDGWQRVAYAHSGTDTRSGRKGRNKYVWQWPHRVPSPSGDGVKETE